MMTLDDRKMKSGVDTRRLPPGTKFFVRTKNSLYVIENLDYGGRVRVQGGKYFKNPTEVQFAGSTFGGSAIKVGWLGYRLRMEFYWKERGGRCRITTSGVRDVLIKTDNYEYRMGWEEES
jgi:hypothetical protein